MYNTIDERNLASPFDISQSLVNCLRVTNRNSCTRQHSHGHIVLPVPSLRTCTGSCASINSIHLPSQPTAPQQPPQAVTHSAQTPCAIPFHSVPVAYFRLTPLPAPAFTPRLEHLVPELNNTNNPSTRDRVGSSIVAALSSQEMRWG